jgi:hypothetical protein
VARINVTKGPRCSESRRRGYVLGLFTPATWDESDSLSVDSGGLVEPRVVLTDIRIGLRGWGEQTRNDAYQAECACDCACA